MSEAKKAVVLLSGGLDSSTVVALMSHILAEPVKTFSVGFAGEGEAYSELPYARLVAKHCATDHHEVECSGHQAVALATAFHAVTPMRKR